MLLLFGCAIAVAGPSVDVFWRVVAGIRRGAISFAARMRAVASGWLPLCCRSVAVSRP